MHPRFLVAFSDYQTRSRLYQIPIQNGTLSVHLMHLQICALSNTEQLNNSAFKNITNVCAPESTILTSWLKTLSMAKRRVFKLIFPLDFCSFFPADFKLIPSPRFSAD